jgi:cephalosporin-C deacetylase-like acetyl esterase
VPEPGQEVLVAFLGVSPVTRVGPFAQSGLDEGFGFAAGLGRVGPGAAVPKAHLLAGAAKLGASDNCCRCRSAERHTDAVAVEEVGCIAQKSEGGVSLLTPFLSEASLTRLLVLPVLLTSTLFAQSPELLHHFDYDQKTPLDIRETAIEQRGDVTVHDISYASPKGGRVPAFLVVPKGKGPFAAVIWGHWYQGGSEFRNRREFLEEAIALAPVGVISLLIDGPINRPGYVEDSNPIGDLARQQRVQAILDMRRGADLLLARRDVDPKRLAYVGHSYNASTGAYLAGIDKRFKAFVLMAGAMSEGIIMKSREFQDFRQKYGAENVDANLSKYAWLDQGKYLAQAAPASVFLQYATQESFLTPERAREFYATVSDPKSMKIYQAKHALNAEAQRDRIAFLVRELDLKEPDPAAIARIPELVQPTEPKK